MPGFSFQDRADAERTYKAVRTVEHLARDLSVSSKPSGLIPFELRRFELAEALATGGHAKAYLRKWSTEDDDYKTDQTITFDVYDADGRVSGDEGATGLAWKPHDCPRWEIVLAPARQPRCKGLTTGSVAKTDATFTVDYVEAVDMGGVAPVDSSSDTFIISNWAFWESESGQRCDFIITDLDAESGSIGHGDFAQGACKADQT
jgi:hypothetical protein